MRIGVQLLKRMPMDFEPTDSVSQVKSRLESIFLDQLKKQGEEVDEVDLTLLFEGEVLEEHLTLESAGLRENSTLVVLSRTLAEIHGEHSGVYSVRRAFEDLAGSGLSGHAAEQQAMKQAPPFSIFCNLEELGELGAGWVLFFHFVRFLGLLCLLLFALQLPTYFLLRSFPEEDLLTWRNFTNTKRDRPIGWHYVTLGNSGPHGADSSWPWLCALGSALLMLILMPQYGRWQQHLREKIDRREVDPDDFALFLDGLPKDATSEEEIKSFIEENGRQGERTEVVMVVISYDLEVFQQMLADIKEAKEQTGEPGIVERLRKLRKPFRSSAALREALPCTGQAVVLLRSQQEHREVLEQWDTFYEWLMNLTPCLKINSRTTRFRKRHVVRITRSANPSDILWENLSASHDTRLRLKLKTYGFVAVTLVGCLVVVVAINWAVDGLLGNRAERTSSGLTTLSSLLVAFSVMGIRIWASMAIRSRVMQQKHMTKTERDVSLLSKLALFYLTSYCIIAVLVNWEPRYWYTAGNLVSDVATLMMFNCITIPLYILCGCRLLIRSSLRDRRLDLDDPPPQLTQNAYQRMFELPDMDQTRPFAKVLLTFLMGLVFMPLWPYAILVAGLALFMEYWAFKYQLLRQSKRPYRQSVNVAQAALRIVYLGLAGFALTQEIFLTPSLSEAQGAWSSSLTIPLLAVPLLLLSLSFRLQRYLCGGFLCEAESTHTEVDFYESQRFWPKHQKYHSTNLVYLRGFEMIDAQQKKLKYDPVTGNLPDPARREEPPSDTRVGSLTDKDADAGTEDVEKGEESELEDAPEETEAIADEDAAQLAMEEMKHKVPWKESDDEASESEASSEEDHPPLSLMSGSTARIVGLKKAGAEQFNGQTCTLLQPQAEKWIVVLSDGRKAAMAPEHLRLQARIVQLRSGHGKVYNGTVATLLRYDQRVEKWLVEFFTGLEAHVASEHLVALRG